MQGKLPDVEQGKAYLGKVLGVVGEYPLPQGYVFAPTYLQAAAVVGLLFLLILMLGQLRRRFVGWTMGGVMPGVAFGFALALVVEGIFVVGGRTIVTELVGWKSAPKPIVNVLDAGRSRLVRVLGVDSEIPVSTAADKPTTEEVLETYGSLSEEEQGEVMEMICEP